MIWYRGCHGNCLHLRRVNYFFLCCGVLHCAVRKLQMTSWDLSLINLFFTFLITCKHPVLLPVYLAYACACECVRGTAMAAHFLIDPASWSHQQNARISKPEGLWSGMSICKLLSRPAGNWRDVLACFFAHVWDKISRLHNGQKAWLSWIHRSCRACGCTEFSMQ